MSAPSLIIAGIELPQRARLDLSQTFEAIGGRSARRMASGALFKMSHWARWKTTISGAGWVPPQLLGINYDQPYTVECVEPLALAVGESLPPTWGSRAAPWDEKTVTDERGVQVRLFFPILTVMSDPPRLITGGSGPSWELVCEEL
jgi:hypothetical protein